MRMNSKKMLEEMQEIRRAYAKGNEEGENEYVILRLRETASVLKRPGLAWDSKYYRDAVEIYNQLRDLVPGALENNIPPIRLSALVRAPQETRPL